jgi:lysophospholipase
VLRGSCERDSAAIGSQSEDGHRPMQLIDTVRNPAPIGAQTGLLSGRKGVKLRFARWPSSVKERRGTVCVFPGRSEFIEKYFEVIGELRRRGFAVAVLDWRGQGGSSRSLRNGRKGDVRNFRQFDEDLALFMREVVLPDCPPPYFALAHSMGGAILLRAATLRDCWFSRIVVTAPMLALSGSPLKQGTLQTCARAACWCGLGRFYVPGGKDWSWDRIPFESNRLTSDPQRYARNQSVLAEAPELGLGAPTVRWLKAALNSMSQLSSAGFPHRLRVPVLILTAGDDTIVCNKAIETFAVQMRSGGQIVLRGAQHEILQERDHFREQFWAAFDAFIPGSAN